jgi:hypothetical protein
VLVVLALSAGLLPASAQDPFPIELPPLVQTDPIAGFGTIAYRVDVPPDSDVGFGVEYASTDFSIDGFVASIYDADGNLVIGGFGTGVGGGGFEYHIEAPDPIGVLADAPGATFDTGPGNNVVLQVFGMPAGEYVVFVGVVTNGSFVSGAGSVYGPEGTKVISKASAVGAFAHRESDFRGLNVLAGVAGLRAKALVSAAVEETTDRPMFGDFGYFGELEFGRLTVEGPEGTQTGSSHILELAPAGDYRFIADIDVGIGNLYVWGVEANFPPPGLPSTGA